MRVLPARWAIPALAIAALLVYAYVDGGKEDPRWIEEELPVQSAASGGTVSG